MNKNKKYYLYCIYAGHPVYSLNKKPSIFYSINDINNWFDSVINKQIFWLDENTDLEVVKDRNEFLIVEIHDDK